MTQATDKQINKIYAELAFNAVGDDYKELEDLNGKLEFTEDWMRKNLSSWDASVLIGHLINGNASIFYHQMKHLYEANRQN